MSVVYVPVAQPFVSPYPKAMIPNYTGDEAGSSYGSGDAALLTQLPTTQNLSWVAGDTATFSFFFPNVCWTPTQPAPPPTLYAWENVTWRSQVRTTKAYYYGYWWPPVFPLGYFIMEFSVDATYLGDPTPDPTLGTGTLVTLTGGTAWPGHFAWDLQSEHHTDVSNPDWYAAQTHLQGKADVTGQVTNPQLTVPSNWGAFPYP